VLAPTTASSLVQPDSLPKLKSGEGTPLTGRQCILVLLNESELSVRPLTPLLSLINSFEHSASQPLRPICPLYVRYVSINMNISDAPHEYDASEKSSGAGARVITDDMFVGWNLPPNEPNEKKGAKGVPRLAHKKSKTGCQRCRARRVKVTPPFPYSSLLVIHVRRGR
jgi:hypothetical protein